MKNSTKKKIPWKVKRGQLLTLVLERIDEGIEDLATLNEAMLTGPLTMRGVAWRKNTIRRRNAEQAMERLMRERLHTIIYKLKQDGCITPRRAGWLITQKGVDKLQQLKNKLLRNKSYTKENDNQLKLVIFDIPEKIRKYRNWLRLALYNLEFTMVQKSVFIGKNKIPQELIETLDHLHILPHVQILTISRYGTLEPYHLPKTNSINI